MTTFSPRTIWTVAVLVSVTALGITNWNYARSKRLASVQVQRLNKLTKHASTISEVGASLPAWAFGPKPPGSLAPEVSAALAGSGLPPSAMASLSAEPESSGSLATGAAGPVQARTRRGTLVLTSVTLPQLGAFCATWRERQPGWSIAALDVGPETGNANARSQIAATGGDLPLRAVLTLESISLERSGGVR